MVTLHMKIGPNLGRVLLEKTQQMILDGEPTRAIQSYIDGLCGFTKEYALMVLKNEAVLVTDKDGININLVDDKETILQNQENIWDWEKLMNRKIDELIEIKNALYNASNKFYDFISGFSLLNYDITTLMERFFDRDTIASMGYHNIAAKLIGGDGFNNQRSNGEKLWMKLCNDVEDGEGSRWKCALYYTVQYNKLIRTLHKEYMEFEPTYVFLTEHGFMPRIPFVESTIELIITVLAEYSDTSKGYYHPMCNSNLSKYKIELKEDLENSRYGKEFLECGIIKKNILDHYEAGWLSPEGDFYGGLTGQLIHCDIAKQLFMNDGPVSRAMKESGVSLYGGEEGPDRWLEKQGWVKIHGEDCYGSFIGIPGYPYCPTSIQIEKICAYADKFYGGKFYTEAEGFGSRISHIEPYSTYKVKQMDKIMLHKIFSL